MGIRSIRDSFGSLFDRGSMAYPQLQGVNRRVGIYPSVILRPRRNSIDDRRKGESAGELGSGKRSKISGGRCRPDARRSV